jgi:uncharacterized protein YbaR (Trm112 family)
MAETADVDEHLLGILACPDCHSPVVVAPSGDELLCTGCPLAYPVRDGIPVMLLDQARHRDAAETGRTGTS